MAAVELRKSQVNALLIISTFHFNANIARNFNQFHFKSGMNFITSKGHKLRVYIYRNVIFMSLLLFTQGCSVNWYSFVDNDDSSFIVFLLILLG